MHVFVTGATGWVGSAVVEDLLRAGHRVTGLARTQEKASALHLAGAQVVLGTLDDLETLRSGAASADAVIHTAFNHDFSKFAENAQQDRKAIEVLGGALAGSDRPILITAGVAMLTPGTVSTEMDIAPSDPSYPRRSEAAARQLVENGVCAKVVRLAPSVHGLGDHGFIPILVAIARQQGVSAYFEDGLNRWPAVHRQDAARLYRLVLEHGGDDFAYHAVADEGVPFRQIAEAIGRGLGLPVQSRSREHFGWFADFATADIPASSEHTRKILGWSPTELDLLTDINQPEYYRS